jgi:hypothetical protein
MKVTVKQIVEVMNVTALAASGTLALLTAIGQASIVGTVKTSVSGKGKPSNVYDLGAEAVDFLKLDGLITPVADDVIVALGTPKAPKAPKGKKGEKAEAPVNTETTPETPVVTTEVNAEATPETPVTTEATPELADPTPA